MPSSVKETRIRFASCASLQELLIIPAAQSIIPCAHVPLGSHRGQLLGGFQLGGRAEVLCEELHEFEVIQITGNVKGLIVLRPLDEPEGPRLPSALEELAGDLWLDVGVGLAVDHEDGAW